MLQRFVVVILSAVILQLAGCQSASYAPPPVTAAMANAGTKHVDLAQLREGRTLFVSRCIECHALPSVTAHTVAEWPRLIDEMADRANLKPAEREALVAYIVAARTR